MPLSSPYRYLYPRSCPDFSLTTPLISPLAPTATLNPPTPPTSSRTPSQIHTPHPPYLPSLLSSPLPRLRSGGIFPLTGVYYPCPTTSPTYCRCWTPGSENLGRATRRPRFDKFWQPPPKHSRFITISCTHDTLSRSLRE